MLALINVLATTHVWHFWLAVLLLPAAVGIVIGVFALYFVKVSRTRYPRK